MTKRKKKTTEEEIEIPDDAGFEEIEEEEEQTNESGSDESSETKENNTTADTESKSTDKDSDTTESPNDTTADESSSSESEQAQTDSDSDSDSDSENSTSDDASKNTDDDTPNEDSDSTAGNDTDDTADAEDSTTENNTAEDKTENKNWIDKLKGMFKKKKESASKHTEGSKTPKSDKTLKTKWTEWWVGTEDKPAPPFSNRMKLVRWFNKNFRGYVDYITTMYDKPIDEIRYDMVCIPKSKVPREAVHVTNMKKTWHLDMDLPIRGFDLTKDNGFTASSAYNYMKSHAIDDAMMVEQERMGKSIDKNKVYLLLALAFGGFMAIYLIYPML